MAVGANWPRASNFVGFILQRLGFELTDLALWMWDPEKSLAREAEIIAGQASEVEEGSAVNDSGWQSHLKEGRREGKARLFLPENHQSGKGARRARSKKVTDGQEPWIRSEELNGLTARVNGNSPLIQV